MVGICVRVSWGGYLKYLFSYAVWDEVCSQPCKECAQCVPSSINLSNNHYCLERRQKHSTKSFNISRRDPHLGVKTHTHDSDSFGVHITTFAEKLFTLQLHQRSKKAQKKQRVRVSWIVFCILNALSTKHDNYKSSKGPRGKINPKIWFMRLLFKQQWKYWICRVIKIRFEVAKQTKTSCCWSFKLVSAKAFYNDSSFIDSWFTLNECQRSNVPNTGGLMRDDLYWKHFCLSSFLQHLTCALNTPAQRDFCNI